MTGSSLGNPGYQWKGMARSPAPTHYGAREAYGTIPRRVKLASALAFCLHGVLILTAGYRLSYDAYNHMFFADHYLRNWWSLWEPRWYTGFEVISYPPLVHQLNALLGRLIGVDAAFGLLLWIVLAAYPLAMYVFSRIFTGRVPAGYAALGAALLPSLYLSGHTFGQLPTLVGTLLALFGAAVLADYLKRPATLSGALAVSLFATSMASHHATLLFQPWLAGAVFLAVLRQERGSRPLLVLRFVLLALLAALAAMVVIWPFWEWGSRQEMQAPIDHLSRHNYLLEPFAAALFFLPVYGWLIPCLPAALRIGRRKRYRGLSLACLFLFLLGLGGTTPLPEIFFGEAWAWLTYERFAFWASLVLLPFIGALAAWLARRKAGQQRASLLVGMMSITALIAGGLPSLVPMQPAPLDMQPVVDFLARGDHASYRYLTFGFGDQLALLSRRSEAATLDGSYHTARTLPELRASGIGQVDAAFWIPGGMAALDPILQKSSEHGVRWAFNHLRFYRPILLRNGWIWRATLSNGVEVWENPDAGKPPPTRPPAASPWETFSWGVLPLLAAFVSATLALQWYATPAARRILAAGQALAAGLLPLGLTFWYYRPLFVMRHSRIYFTYSDALFFLADALALAIVLVWLVQRLSNRRHPARRPGTAQDLLHPREILHYAEPPFRMTPSVSKPAQRLVGIISRPESWLLGLIAFAGLSSFWSLDWRTSLYISLHLGLCFCLFLALRDAPQSRLPFALGCSAALVGQFLIGAGQVALQSTAWTAPLGLQWPGDLLPAMSGASVVQLADGARWLRAYGTLPHPNLLGGFALALLAAPLASFLPASPRPVSLRLLLLIAWNAALASIALTFSRSAWVGLAVLALRLAAGWKQLDRNELRLLGVTGLATLSLLFLRFQPWFFTRLGASRVPTEQVSSFTRFWLVERAVELFQARPWIGSGVGSFSLALSQHVADFYEIEPVHNLLLLVAAELGIGGLVLLGGLVAAVVLKARRARRPAAVVFSAVLAALAAASLFDHYFWSLAPGRILIAAVLGLWAAHVQQAGLRGEGREECHD